MAKIGVGIIGLGVMGRSMMEALEAHPSFQVTGWFDPANPAGIPARRFETTEALVADPDVDLVYVASPPNHHLAGVMSATAARKPLLCEKPLAATVEEAERCVALVMAAGVPAAVNFFLAGSDAGVRMRRIIGDGLLGSIESARLTLRFRQWPRPWQMAAGRWLALPEAGGFTREVMSHFLFQMHRLFGLGQVIAADVERGPVGTETSVQARVAFGALDLTIDARIAGTLDESNRLEITGEKGHVALVDWDALEVAGINPTLAPTLESFRLDSLADMFAGRDHELASFAEAAHVVALSERLVAGISA